MTHDCVAVAYSGGRDSSALLHATLAAAKPLGIGVVALHVNHGLNPRADDWLAHCEAQCAKWAERGLPSTFASFRTADSPAQGQSVEAWARATRYHALRRMAVEHGVALVLLAHHRRDQAETFLLQALRGAGPAGLSGMPTRILREGVTWARPWLSRSREDIDAYVAHHRIVFVEDDSNTDPRFARNRLRTQVWPALARAFPEAEAALADSAQWSRDAQVGLSELAAHDMGLVQCSAGGLDVAKLLDLSMERRSNVLRAWLKTHLLVAPPSSLVVRLKHELRPSGAARWPTDGGELRLYRGVLRFARVTTAPLDANDGMEATLSVNRAGDFPLPGWGGGLRVSLCGEGGVPLAWLGRLELRRRQGAEQFQAGVGRPPRSLKKQYQSSGVAEWDRAGPLFYSGGQLVYVPGLGIDARVRAMPGQPQVDLAWLPLGAGKTSS